MKFDFNQAVSDKSQTVETLKNNEKIRLKHLYDSVCCACGKNKKTTVGQNDQSPIIQFNKLSITKDPNAVDNFYKYHVICSSCCDYISKRFKTKLGERSISQIIDVAHKSLSLELDCKLCGVNHSTHVLTNDPIAIKNIKSNDKACCGGCNIF